MKRYILSLIITLSMLLSFVPTTIYATAVFYDINGRKSVAEKADASDISGKEPESGEWKNSFIDIEECEWFFKDIKCVNESNLMSGVTENEFKPMSALTRGMLVSVIYRAAGAPEVNKSTPFADVLADSYYQDAVIWARQNGIISGINKSEFALEQNVTREQIALIMFRYAKYMGYDVSVGASTNILSYTDFEEISEYAIEAMQYAVGSSIMKGKTEATLNPKDFAARAEIAALLNRFIEYNK